MLLSDASTMSKTPVGAPRQEVKFVLQAAAVECKFILNFKKIKTIPMNTVVEETGEIKFTLNTKEY